MIYNHFQPTKPSAFSRSRRSAKSSVAFAFWITRSPTPRTPCPPKSSFRRSRSAVAPTSTCPSSATHTRCRPRAGSSAWCRRPSRRATPRRKSGPAWSSSARSHRSLCRSRTISSQPTMASSRKSSSLNHTTPRRTSRQHAWTCWTSSSAAPARTLTFPRSSRSSATRNSKLRVHSSSPPLFYPHFLLTRENKALNPLAARALKHLRYIYEYSVFNPTSKSYCVQEHSSNPFETSKKV